jgi:hypothetical protein
MKTVSENTAYDKQKKAMLDAIKESGLVDKNNSTLDTTSTNDEDYYGSVDYLNANGVV